MWPTLFIALLCVLMPSAYGQEITISKFGPLKPNECGVSNVTLRSRIVSGQLASIGAWPWMTALGYDSGNPAKPNWKCGGCLISEQHVLTAAHCILPDLRLVRIGDLDLMNDNDVTQPFQDNIQRIVMHPKWNPRTLENDIAVLKTIKKVPFTSVLHPICLPVDDKIRNRNLDNLYAMIAGWGRIYYQGPQSFKLLQTQVPVSAQKKCIQNYFNHAVFKWLDERVVCAGSPGISTCHGDSGGPLMISDVNNQKLYYVIGVVSGAEGCARPNYPTVFTRITYYLPFITKSMALM